MTADRILADRYALGAVLGRGGMADVYAAVDLRLERPVAVKLLRGAESGAGGLDGTATSEAARRFAAEVRAMARLAHPSVVHLYDADTAGDVPYLVMERIDGPALPSLLSDGPLPPDRVAAMGADLAAALAHAHDLGITHRDVKPSNVLVDGDGRARLADFGIARLADQTRFTNPDGAMGSAPYAAPEQVAGEDVAAAADVYSLGLVLLEALTGIRAFPGGPVEAAFARLTRAPEIPQDLPDGWAALLAVMTARDPARRPTAREVAAALRAGDPGAVAPAAPDDGQVPTAVLPGRGADAAAGGARPSGLSPAAQRAAVAAGALLLVLLAAALFGRSGDDGSTPPGEAPVADADAVDDVPATDPPVDPLATAQAVPAEPAADGGGASAAKPPKPGKDAKDAKDAKEPGGQGGKGRGGGRG